MEGWTDQDRREVLIALGAWMAERGIEPQYVHIEAYEVTIQHYSSGWDRKLKEFSRDVSSTVSRPVVVTDQRKELLVILGERANLEGQVETGLFDKAQMNSAGARY